MLKICTYLDRSTVDGIGLFAGENVDQGSEIWAFNRKIDFTYSHDQWLELLGSVSLPCSRALRRYSYKEGGQYYLCLDNAQFMNHCPESYNVGNDPAKNIMFAITDIKKGDELLCNYFEYSDPDDAHVEYLSCLKTQYHSKLK